MANETYRICVAYEQGFGDGYAKRTDKSNPYMAKTVEHEAWSIGFATGLRRSSEPTAAALFAVVKELIEADAEGLQAGMNGNTSAQLAAHDRYREAVKHARALIGAEKVSHN